MILSRAYIVAVQDKQNLVNRIYHCQIYVHWLLLFVINLEHETIPVCVLFM